MENDAARWTRRAGDAATEAVLAGADPEALVAAVRAGIAEGQRVRALRQPAPAAAPAPRGEFVPPRGSAVEQLLRAAG